MRFPRTVSALGLGLALACSNSDGPTAIEIPIDSIEIRGSCFVAEGETCQLQAEARAGGILVSNPVLRWSSSATNIASVEGQSLTAIVRGHAPGEATVTASNTTGDVSDDVRVLVLPCSKC